MSELAKDFFGVLMAVVGVAVLTALFKPGNQTAAVTSSFFTGFSQSLSAALGGASGNTITPIGIN
jgi:cobalamin synthase